MSADNQAIKILAVAVLRLPDGKLVLQRRTDDAPVAPGLLAFFGGHIEKGETPEDCVRRELAEETSLDVGKLNIQPVKELMLPASANYNQDRHFFIFEASAATDNFDVFEGVGHETYSKQELLARSDVSEVVRRVLEQDVS